MARTTFAVAVVLGALGLAASAGAQDPIKARQAEFKEFGKRMGAIKDTVIDRKGGTMADVAANAEYLAAKIPQIPAWFPEGSDKGETRALPDIWLNFADFEAKAKNAASLAQALVVAAKSGEQMATAQAFGKLGQEGCGGCHQPYRRPQN
ncbi:MAG: cytochrome c [Geminicoccaceae bacterium]|nr:cytochrome c [Geminicoccaceae bacterium]MCX8099766.1 cytochrome c [Geminicoccaceae bacterium]MDW8370944.1 cytochrome c [Geminicoccaceae bacterium]